LEQAASRKLGKQKKNEHQHAMEINQLEHVVKKKAPLAANEVNYFQEQAEFIRFATGNEVSQLEKQKKQECQ